MLVNVHEAKTQLSRLIAAAEAGDDVVIARKGKPAVRLVPLKSGRFQFDTLAHLVDNVPEFDEAMDEDELALWKAGDERRLAGHPCVDMEPHGLGSSRRRREDGDPRSGRGPRQSHQRLRGCPQGPSGQMAGDRAAHRCAPHREADRGGSLQPAPSRPGPGPRVGPSGSIRPSHRRNRDRNGLELISKDLEFDALDGTPAWPGRLWS